MKIKPLKETAKEVRQQLKKEFPEWKFSVTTKYFAGGQEMTVSLMSGPRSPYADTLTFPDGFGKRYPITGYNQLNDKHIEKRRFWDEQAGEMREVWVSNFVILTEEAAQMLKRVIEIANQDNWDNSEPMTDYFDVGYWFHLQIGKWDKPFEVKPPKK